MKIKEQSYGGRLFRPSPILETSNDERILIIATPWGDPKIATDFSEIALSQLNASSEDPDKTVLFERSGTLDHEESKLQDAIMSAHNEVSRKYNEDEYRAGLEVLCLFKNNNKLTWYQVGAPYLSIIKNSQLIPIHHPIDLSFDFSIKDTLAPLPKNMLGVTGSLSLEIGSLRTTKDDQLLLISRSYVPHDIFKIDPDTLSVEDITQALANESPQLPFWVGIISF